MKQRILGIFAAILLAVCWYFANGILFSKFTHTYIYANGGSTYSYLVLEFGGYLLLAIILWFLSRKKAPLFAKSFIISVSTIFLLLPTLWFLILTSSPMH